MGKNLFRFKLAFIVIGICLYSSGSQLAQFEIPNTNIQSVFKHQKELIGAKRAPDILLKNNKADQVVSQLVLEITSQNLPKEYKRQSVKIASAIVREANRYGLDPLFLTSIIRQESAFNPKAVGTVGELGLMQIRPCTADWLNKKYKIVKKIKLRDPVNNIKIGAFYISKLRDNFFRNSHNYITAYNMGSAKLKRKLAQKEMPKEYVGNVMKHYVGYITRLNKAFMNAAEEIELFEMPLPDQSLALNN